MTESGRQSFLRVFMCLLYYTQDGVDTKSCDRIQRDINNREVCVCGAGYRSKRDNSACEDIDECVTLVPPPCLYKCVNHDGTYSCQDCPLGFEPNTNYKGCVQTVHTDHGDVFRFLLWLVAFMVVMGATLSICATRKKESSGKESHGKESLTKESLAKELPKKKSLRKKTLKKDTPRKETLRQSTRTAGTTGSSKAESDKTTTTTSDTEDDDEDETETSSDGSDS